MILYFSGTGNSRYVANNIGLILNDEVVSINDYLKKNNNGNFDSTSPYVFITPTYMSRMPMEVEKFINNSLFAGNKNAYFIFTAGECIGNAYKYCEKICVHTKLHYKGTTSIAMAANYVLMYDVLPRERAKEEAKKVDSDIQKIGDSIKNLKQLNLNTKMSGHKAFSPIAPVFNSLMVSAKGFNVDSSCVGCGKCAKACPLNNIKISDKKPTWSNKCMHCMACISICPNASINYGKKTQKRNRYYLDV